MHARSLGIWRLQRSLRLGKSRLFCRNQSTGENDSEGGIDRAAILKASMQFVPQHGWSIKSLQLGAESMGLPSVTHGLFPNGGADLVEHFELDCNDRLIEFLREAPNQETPLKGGRLIHSAVEERLRMLVPYLDTWPEVLVIKSYPTHLPSSLNRHAQLMDDMWYYAGDRSTDINWYTKRGLLAAVYCSTELHLVQDRSDDYRETWEFLKRRLEDTRTVTETRQQVEGLVSFAGDLMYAGAVTVCYFTCASSISSLVALKRTYRVN